MSQLTSELINRLNEIGKKAKQLTLKIMIRAKNAPVETMKFMGHGVCDSISKSIGLPTYTNTEILIESSVLKLLHALKIEPSELRGIGIQLSKFEVDESNKNSNTLLNLFKKVAEKKRKSNELKLEGEINLEGSEQPEKKVKINETKMEKPQLQESSLQKWMKAGESTKNIPLKTSPIKIETTVKRQQYQTSKSPVKRGRGRPPKSATLTRKPSNSDISVMFNSKKVSKQTSTEISSSDIIDVDVLMELPDEIRSEILKQYKEHEKTLEAASPKKESCKLKDNSAAMLAGQSSDEPKSATSRDPSAKEVKKEKKLEPSAENILMKKDWRQLIQSWVDFDKPNVKDVDVLIESAYEMIGLEKISDLFIRLKFLFRIIDDTKSCTWHQVYFRIINPIQNEFKDIFGAKLYVEENFDCEYCKNCE